MDTADIDNAEGDPRRRGARTTEGVEGWTISGSEPDDDAVLADATDLLHTESPATPGPIGG